MTPSQHAFTVTRDRAHTALAAEVAPPADTWRDWHPGPPLGTSAAQVDRDRRRIRELMECQR